MTNYRNQVAQAQRSIHTDISRNRRRYYEIRETGRTSASKIAVLTCLLVLSDTERTRGRLLQEVFQEMHAQGFEALTWTSFWPQQGVTKGALYHQFDDKEALQYAVVNKMVASLTRETWVRPLRNAKNAIDTLIRTVQSTSLKPEALEHGCPLNNLSQEMSPSMRDAARGRRLSFLAPVPTVEIC